MEFIKKECIYCGGTEKLDVCECGKYYHEEKCYNGNGRCDSFNCPYKRAFIIFDFIVNPASFHHEQPEDYPVKIWIYTLSGEFANLNDSPPNDIKLTIHHLSELFGKLESNKELYDEFKKRELNY